MKRKGVTLIELVIMIAILVLLAGIILPVAIVMFQSFGSNAPSLTPRQEVETAAPVDDQFSQVWQSTLDPFVLNSII